MGTGELPTRSSHERG